MESIFFPIKIKLKKMIDKKEVFSFEWKSRNESNQPQQIFEFSFFYTEKEIPKIFQEEFLIVNVGIQRLNQNVPRGPKKRKLEITNDNIEKLKRKRTNSMTSVNDSLTYTLSNIRPSNDTRPEYYIVDNKKK